jgi:hypothetical protein
MLEQLIGKHVEITVALAACINSGGLMPVSYFGILKAVDENFCLLALRYKQPVFVILDPLGMAPRQNLGENCSGDMYIKIDSILTCHELPSQ